MSFTNARLDRDSRKIAQLRAESRSLNDIAAVSPEVAMKLLMRSFMYPQASQPTEHATEILALAEQQHLAWQGYSAPVWGMVSAQRPCSRR